MHALYQYRNLGLKWSVSNVTTNAETPQYEQTL